MVPTAPSTSGIRMFSKPPKVPTDRFWNLPPAAGPRPEFHHFVAAGSNLLRGAEPNTYNRQGLEETPQRFAKAWEFWTSGYRQRAEDVLKVFEDGAEGVDEMVTVANLPFYTHCEHHLAPFFGTATISYVPNGKIIGLSKLPRLLDIYARRLQVQERLTTQIVDALMDNLRPRGAACKIKARHLCMESRGVCQQGHHTVTTALRGVFKSDPSARAEFLAIH